MRKVTWLCLLSLFAVALSLSISNAAIWQQDGTKITAGQTRFTVISPITVRIEYSPASQFIDEPSVVAINRDFIKPDFTVAEDNEWLVVRTAALELRFLPDYGPPSEQNLVISWKIGHRGGTWRPGKADTANLLGTRGALDLISTTNLPPLDPGLLSREGWTYLDDSERPLWLGEDGWLKPRPNYDARDGYFFAYGNDYGLMLEEYVKLCGKVPMLPRYAWGTWFSRYWPYTDTDLKDIVNKFAALDIPLDVLVIDVDWHKYGWEGYDWNTDLIPDPEGLLKWVHDQGVAVTLNNHPGSALPVEDTHYPEAAKVAGITGDALGKPFNWDLANKAHNRSFVEAVHWPLEDIGVDFWWIDGCASANMRGLHSNMWTAKTYYDGTQRRTGMRSMVFSRYDGAGQHRYPAGFSGDVYSEWAVLNYEVRFTSRAGNVLFPYWSHDIGGFMGDRIDPELYIRWAQFGCLSPIMRLHSNHGIREPWEYGPQAQEIVRDYTKLREQLYPYFNTCQRKVYDTGMPLCQAMYMGWPDADEAYEFDYQYMLGPFMLVAPITEAGVEGVGEKTIWLPHGTWWDYWTGEAFQGSLTMQYQASLDRCPIFIQAGAIIPRQTEKYDGVKTSDKITLDVWSGAQGEFSLYEDDGLSLEYQESIHATTKLSWCEDTAGGRLVIAPREGKYQALPANRNWTVRLHGFTRPTQVMVNDKILLSESWRWEAEPAVLTIMLPEAAVNREVVVDVAGGQSVAASSLGRLMAIRQCARKALSVAQKAGLDATLQNAIKNIITQADATAPSALKQTLPGSIELVAVQDILAKVWKQVGENCTDTAGREQVLSALLGLRTTSRLVQTSANAPIEVKTILSSQITVPATVTAKVFSDSHWPVKGEPSIDINSFGTSASAPVSFTVEPPKSFTQAPLGQILLGTDYLFTWQDISIPFVARSVVDCSFIQQWQIIGSFSNRDINGLETVYPPEQEWIFEKSYPALEGEAKWQALDWKHPTVNNPPVFVNLAEHFKPVDQAIAYAATYVISDREQEVILSIGTDDGCKIWVNNEQVFNDPTPRPPAPGQNQVKATLHPGINKILMKVVNYSGQWGLYLQLRSPDSTALDGLLTTVKP